MPRWAQTFRCRQVEPRCNLEKRRLIARREQVRTATLMQQTLSQKLKWFLRDYQEETNKGKSRTELLKEVYLDWMYQEHWRQPGMHSTTLASALLPDF